LATTEITTKVFVWSHFFFCLKARFDVYRHERARHFYAVVKDVDFSGPVMKIFFHFAKTNEKFDEWIEFGSSRICALNSKVAFVAKGAKRKKLAKELTVAYHLSVFDKVIVGQAESRSGDTSDKKMGSELDLTLRQVSEANDAPICQMSVASLPVQVQVTSASDASKFAHETASRGNQSIVRNTIVEQEPDKLTDFASFMSVAVPVPVKILEPSNRVHRPFVEASRSSTFNNGSSRETFVSMDVNGSSLETFVSMELQCRNTSLLAAKVDETQLYSFLL
jgi:hypothetical protein